MNGRITHLKTHNLVYGKKIIQSKLPGVDYAGFQMSVLNEKLAKFIACSAQPFSIVEEAEFRNLICYAA